MPDAVPGSTLARGMGYSNRGDSMAKARRRTVTIIVERVEGDELDVDEKMGESDLAVSVVPARIVLKQGDRVTWRLHCHLDKRDPCARGPYPKFRVSPKQPNWPFEEHPHTGNRRDPADSGRMRDHSAGRHKYNVTVICPGETVEIDPDMDVME